MADEEKLNLILDRLARQDEKLTRITGKLQWLEDKLCEMSLDLDDTSLALVEFSKLTQEIAKRATALMDRQEGIQ